MLPKCAPTHMLGGESIIMADAVFLFIRGSWNPGRMGLPCQVPGQAFWSRKMWNSRGRSRKHTAWSSVPGGFPGTSIWGSEASDQFSSRGYAVLGSEEMGHWSEQLLGESG